MTDLTAVIHDLVGLFDRLRLPYAIMGGIAVRAHGLPRPTFDVDFVLAVPRERLADLFTALKEAGYTVPDHYHGGWVDSVGGMPLFKVRLFLEGRGIDADVFLVENEFQKEVMSRRILDEVEGKPVHLITAEDLIRGVTRKSLCRSLAIWPSLLSFGVVLDELVPSAVEVDGPHEASPAPRARSTACRCLPCGL